MPGTLTISTLSDGTNSTSATNPIFGSAKAWVKFNATGPTINDSYNVSSVTTSGTGYFLINFTNAFANTDYCPVFTVGVGDTTVNRNAQTGATFSTTQLSFNTGDGAGTPVNCSVNCAVVFSS